jgi:hypothetical protein
LFFVPFILHSVPFSRSRTRLRRFPRQQRAAADGVGVSIFCAPAGR